MKSTSIQSIEMSIVPIKIVTLSSLTFHTEFCLQLPEENNRENRLSTAFSGVGNLLKSF